MPLAGTSLLPRKVSRILYDLGWVNAENHALMLATLMAESNLYTHAYHYNAPADGQDGSTDWGPCQLNDGNKGGLPPRVVDGLPVPQAGGAHTKTQEQLDAFVAMATDPARCFAHARKMYEARSFAPWYAGPSYPHADGTGWKKWYTTATAGLRNMLHEKRGFPLA